MDTATILNHLREFRLVRGFAPRRVYVTMREYHDALAHPPDFGHGLFPISTGPMIDGVRVRVSEAAPQIRAWDLLRAS